LTVFFRHAGLSEDELSPRLRELASTRMLDRARILGAAMRVAYLLSAGQGGVLPKTPLRVTRGRLVLRLSGRFAALSGDRVFNRLRQLARLIGREAKIEA
jgi:exopolyphosphatase/guanosine-5'-triphosphate,3'-diphosphate pyrophosphatase